MRILWRLYILLLLVRCWRAGEHRVAAVYIWDTVAAGVYTPAGAVVCPAAVYIPAAGALEMRCGCACADVHIVAAAYALAGALRLCWRA